MSSSFPPGPPETRSRAKTIVQRWWFWAIVGLVIFLAIGALAGPTDTGTVVGSPQPTVRPSVMTALVPGVQGMKLDDARTELENVDLQASVTTKLTNKANRGVVLEQSVPAYSKVDVGTEITLVVAKGFLLVPYVTGDKLANAKRSLKQAGFKVGNVSEKESGKPKGPVLAQTPKAGKSVKPGTSVKLVVAKAAPPTPEL